MKRLIIWVLMAFVMFVEVMAQKTCVVANAEDHVPIREALIHTNNNHWARTDYRGYWSMKYQFDSATVSKSGFLKTTVYLKELPDTVFLIPESTQLGTVEVWGKDQQHVKDMEDQVQQAASMIGSGTTGIGIDLGNMLDSRGRRDQKHLRNARKILGEYDKKDPIVSAYEQATGKQIQLSPPGMKKKRKVSRNWRKMMGNPRNRGDKMAIIYSIAPKTRHDVLELVFFMINYTWKFGKSCNFVAKI